MQKANHNAVSELGPDDILPEYELLRLHHRADKLYKYGSARI
jgi:hypothetical protein